MTGEPTHTTQEQRNDTAHPSYIIYCPVPMIQHCQLYSTRYTAVRINNCLKRASVAATDDVVSHGQTTFSPMALIDWRL